MNEQTKLVWADKKEFTLQELADLGYGLIRRTWIVDGKEYNLASMGWSFGFNEHKASLGLCTYRPRKIELSLEWMRINTSSPADMEEVIRHEIAHAIDYHKRGKSDHSKLWKKVCVQVGANPVRCHNNPDTKQPKSKYTLRCRKCGYEAKRHRMVSRSYSCGPCGNGKYNPDLKLEVIQNW